ncbi:MAG: helix-turn-helix domain-containing protein [Candidatus Nanoarchaeia archaeon]|nr:helix-turn-helix domain-containing protein [Candidatus Nanoarchaeia archaeon]
MKTTQEMEVWYTLPALRKQLTIELKRIGLSQTEIAKILCVRPSAVSQYIKNKRATNFEFNEAIKKEINKSAKKLKEGTCGLIEELNRLCLLIRRNGHLCSLHKQTEPTLKNCKACLK